MRSNCFTEARKSVLTRRSAEDQSEQRASYTLPLKRYRSVHLRMLERTKYLQSGAGAESCVLYGRI